VFNLKKATLIFNKIECIKNKKKGFCIEIKDQKTEVYDG